LSHQTVAKAAELESSYLYSLARVAMASSVGGQSWDWPVLDFSDPAQRQFGDYELLAELGRGGMGVVYRARQRSLDREVALKFIAAGMADPLQVARFLGEARAAAKLVHPNIVPVFEVGSVGEVHYFSMPLIDGETLDARLKRVRLPRAEMLSLLIKVGEAVDYAHRLGLLHLDLKPANILIDTRSEPLVADFGLARHMDAEGGVKAQEVSGTPAYMAPEQILIEQYRLTVATDVYALGALLYRSLSGASPHGEGASADLIRRALAGQIRPLSEVAPGVDRDLAAVCAKCLALDQRDRYASVRELVADLRRAEAGIEVSVRSPGWLERTRRWIRREPKLALAQAVAFAAISLGAAIGVVLWQQSEAARKGEAEQRERALLAAELGGKLYAHSVQGDAQPPGAAPTNADPRAASLRREQRAAQAVVGWLQQRLPDDPARQAAVLGDFARALKDSQAQGQLLLLLRNVIEVMGVGYRQQVIAALEAKGSADALALAAIVAWQEESKLAQPLRVKQLLDRALAFDPEHALALRVAALYCSGPLEDQCAQVDAAERLAQSAPDDAWAWALLAARRQGPEAYAALHEAAQRKPGLWLIDARSVQLDAIRASGVAPPPLMAAPARILHPDAPVDLTVANLTSWSQPLFWITRVARMCNPQAGFPAMPDDPAVRADCLKVGAQFALGSGDQMLAGIAATIVARLEPQSAEQQQIQEQQRRREWLAQSLRELTPAQRQQFPAERFQDVRRAQGDLAAMEQMVAASGRPTQPPADWEPPAPNPMAAAR
jgi:hypothetical protein